MSKSTVVICYLTRKKYNLVYSLNLDVWAVVLIALFEYLAWFLANAATSAAALTSLGYFELLLTN